MGKHLNSLTKIIVMAICKMCKKERGKLTVHHRRHGGTIMICELCHDKINKHQKFMTIKKDRRFCGKKETA